MLSANTSFNNIIIFIITYVGGGNGVVVAVGVGVGVGGSMKRVAPLFAVNSCLYLLK